MRLVASQKIKLIADLKDFKDFKDFGLTGPV